MPSALASGPAFAEPVPAAVDGVDLTQMSADITAEFGAAGVVFGPGVRFHVDPVPRVIDGAEWATLEAGLINVARGGTLHQHLPDVTDGSIEHRQRAPGRRSTHAVRLQAGSAVARALRETETVVNSFHHQAVDELGSALIVVGHAPDGVVEAIEATDHPHLRGVQWHAETLVERPAHLGLFAELVRAAA